MKEMKLTNSEEVVLIDDEDLERLSQYTWHLNNGGYVVTYRLREAILIHRKILNVSKGLFVDHINHNKLDNRKKNLRICTQRQNNANKDRSKVDGIYFNNKTKKWNVKISNKHIALFKEEDKIAALNCYNYYAKEFFGEFASLNDVKFMEKDVWTSKKCTYSSQYNGVTYRKNRNKWEVNVTLGKFYQKYIGIFKTEIEAAQAYNDWLDENYIIIKEKNIIAV